MKDGEEDKVRREGSRQRRRKGRREGKDVKRGRKKERTEDVKGDEAGGVDRSWQREITGMKESV